MILENDSSFIILLVISLTMNSFLRYLNKYWPLLTESYQNKNLYPNYYIDLISQIEILQDQENIKIIQNDSIRVPEIYQNI